MILFLNNRNRNTLANVWYWKQILFFCIGDNYALKMRFLDHVFDDMVVDQMTLKIILPEGAK